MHTQDLAPGSIDFYAVVNSLSGMVWITRTDGGSRFVNESWREYTGMAADEAQDERWWTTVHAEHLTALQSFWTSVKIAAPNTEIDVRLRRFDGEYRWFTVNARPFQN